MTHGFCRGAWLRIRLGSVIIAGVPFSSGLPMPLSWTEIRQRAIDLSRRWSDAHRERGESQAFWIEFFNVFGVRQSTVASFEEPVRNLRGDTDFIDLFWKGKLIVEQKSRGRSLDKASSQAHDYIQSLHNSGRGEEVPRYILVSDFANLALHDLEAPDPAQQTLEFSLSELPRHIRAFAFIAGYETRKLDPEDPVNIQAVERLGNLHDRLEAENYTGHELQRFMVRVLFCLFADDTGIFDPDSFKLFIEHHTKPDGSDLGVQLQRFFGVLNTPVERRQKNLPDDLAALPYVNGDLFGESLPFPEFSSAMRTALQSCCGFHWDRISPAVFGSLFQSIMEAGERRQIGAHYTSERDILKLIRSLFLDDLRAEFDATRRDKRKLEAFHRRLGQMKFLDPACGCGNFLVIAYRELRRLEMDVLAARFGEGITEGDVRAECRLHVGQMFGIEIEEWPVRIAEVALWLMDHQMNQELFHRFGQARATTPLTRSAHIRHGNALRVDWNDVLPASECSFVMGNPPFVGKKEQSSEQKQDVAEIWGDLKGAGTLDYVTCWYAKAIEYVANTPSVVAFVSTNSITQGEQAGVLWMEMFKRRAIIRFAHRSFAWESEARGQAHVHVVIIGFSVSEPIFKRIYDYDADENLPTIVSVRNISPYLVEGANTALLPRRKAICKVPEMVYGSFALDDGNYTLSPEDRDQIISDSPSAEKYIKPFVGGNELLYSERRYCLWLQNADPTQLRKMPEVLRRVEAVRQWRSQSDRKTTKELANTPTCFAEVRQPKTRYLAIPTLSSERRRYIPIGFLGPETIASNQIYILPQAGLWHLGILHSEMHMAWIKHVAGRLEKRYRYSNSIVYNNFPWPTDVTEKQKSRVEEAAQGVLDARELFPESTLADLYDPVAMPAKLAKAHAELDRAVDLAYRPQPFTSERHRVEYLFGLYEKLIAPLAAPTKKTTRRSARQSSTRESA